MPLFEPETCVCGFNTGGVEIQPNPLGEYFCPRCGRELILAAEQPEPKTDLEKTPDPEATTDPEKLPEE